MTNEMTSISTSASISTDSITNNITDSIIATLKAERSTGQARTGHAVKGYKTRTTADGTPVYEAQIGIGGRKVYLGSFSAPEEATAAYAAAKARIHELRQQPQ